MFVRSFVRSFDHPFARSFVRPCIPSNPLSATTLFLHIHSKLIKGHPNKAGYTAVRCVPLVISSLTPSLIAPSFVTPFPARFITCYHFLSPWVIPGNLDSQKDAFSCIQKISGTNGPMDGPTDGWTDPPIEMRGRI